MELLFSYVEYIELKETWCNWVAVTRWYRRDGCTLPYSVLIFFFLLLYGIPIYGYAVLYFAIPLLRELTGFLICVLYQQYRSVLAHTPPYASAFL